MVVVCLLGWAAFPQFCGSRHSKRKMIVNNLYIINGATAAWLAEHQSARSKQLNWEDLRPYLPEVGGSHGVVAAAGEVYEITTADKAPQARLTRKLYELPTGTIIRLDRGAAVYDVPLPNEHPQPARR